MCSGKFLIADAGGTSTQWCLCAANQTVVAELTTGGINAAVTPDDVLSREIWRAGELIAQADCIYFYGAGCMSDFTNRRVFEQLSLYSLSAHIEVASDMLGAARALFGKSPGIACILGTGSNSCVYSGSSIVENIPPLGYILGDEGSGAALGKRFVREVLRGRLNDEALLTEFRTIAGGDIPVIMSRVYRQSGANSYLATFAPLLAKFRKIPEVANLINEEFKVFYAKRVTNYNSFPGTRIGFIGSLAKAFESELLEPSKKYGFKDFSVQKSPMQGLIHYHSNENYAK